MRARSLEADPHATSVNLVGDFNLLIAVVIAVAGIAAALIARGLVVKLLIVAVAMVVAAYVAGLLPPLPL